MIINSGKDSEIIKAALWLEKSKYYRNGEKGLLEALRTMKAPKAKKMLKVDDAQYRMLKQESISLNIRKLKEEVEEGKVKL